MPPFTEFPMPRFRNWGEPPAAAAWPNADTVHTLISDAVHRNHFYIDDALRIEFSPPAEEEIFWELFHGRALDRSQTRQRRRFLAWNVWDRNETAPSDEPLLSTKWDR